MFKIYTFLMKVSFVKTKLQRTTIIIPWAVPSMSGV